ncbi:hypothetical protein PGTUg99_026353 [Puccinia graminis f. sp. tritici]|uniref:Uncharacterized protein n=1 Tax=Puccinia graminis f. sp. tritici TaxID=56615 RepID=A0A5B0RY69_PUCGR|nr:hypothetical protein PGTUg99_026353 [Puccinia graminis f. sp. tritici]
MPVNVSWQYSQSFPEENTNSMSDYHVGAFENQGLYLYQTLESRNGNGTFLGARGVSGDETSERRPAESELHPGPGTEPEECLQDERGTSLQMPKNKLGPQAQLGWLD